MTDSVLFSSIATVVVSDTSVGVSQTHNSSPDSISAVDGTITKSLGEPGVGVADDSHNSDAPRSE